MPYPLQILVNDFAIRSFRDTADRDYVNARLAYRARLIQQFQWSSLHCLEKYVKCILLLNRIEARHLRHEVTAGLALVKKAGRFEIDVSKAVTKFIRRLEDGAQFRYFEISYDEEEFDIIRLDCAVSEIRRYCQLLDIETESNGQQVNQLDSHLKRISAAKTLHPKDTCIVNGWIEQVLENSKHSSRPGLVWKNLYFGTSRRKSVKLRPDWEVGNAPLWLNPQMIDEVTKYSYLPTKLADAYRRLAKEKADTRPGDNTGG